MSPVEIRPLDRRHRRDEFDCGSEPLNRYLREFALQNQKKDGSRTYVLSENDGRVIGYFTLIFGSLSVSEADPELSKGLGRYPVPIIILGRLAVDVTQKGKGLGKKLLRDALFRAVGASEIGGLKAIVVHAKDGAARSFYERFGFRQLPMDGFHLYLKIADIRASMGIGTEK